jgi:hypothetical protein
MSFTCPVCWRTSYHPEDEKWGYCGNCHDFTGGSGYGYQRYRSSSTPAGQEREMRMPTTNEDGKAQPEMPEVPRQRNHRSLSDLLGIRVEPDDESAVQKLRRTGLSLKSYLIWGLTGITMGIAIASNIYIRWPRQGAIVTTCIIFFVTGLQFAWMISEWMRLKREERELKADNEKFLEQTKAIIAGMYPDDPIKAARIYMSFEENMKI